MSDRYRREYSEVSVYANVVELVRRHRVLGGQVLLDLGCGFGAIAEPVRDLGLSYVGVDNDERCLVDLKKRGFEVAEMDLSDPSRLRPFLEPLLDGRSIAALTVLDVLEHFTCGPELLEVLQAMASANGRPPLVISVPNATHIDIAAKTLIGRFDYTDSGLLDETHVAFYSPSHLEKVMKCSGWAEVGRKDYELSRSDQHFPSDVAVLAPGAPLRRFLLQIREHAGEGAIVNQFVRAYIPTELVLRSEGLEPHAAPFLSVLVRTQAQRRSTIVETLLSLAAQTVQDFEVLIVVHDVASEHISELQRVVEWFDADFADRVRIVRAEGGGRARPLNVAVEQARGQYVAALDDDDIAFAHWVEEFRRCATANPGAAVRAIVAEQDIESVPWGEASGYTTLTATAMPFPSRFDLWVHLFENQSPFCGFAFPRSFFTEMGVRFDESLPVVEDWDVILRAASLCGVMDCEEVTSLYRRWQSPHSSLRVHRPDEWHRSRDKVLAKIDQGPLLIPPGAVSDYLRLYDELEMRRKMVDQLVFERNAARDESSRRAGEISELANRIHTTQIAQNLAIEQAERTQKALSGIYESLSWRLTKPLRALKSMRGRRRAP
jgi:GT2 family glycosyltransferase